MYQMGFLISYVSNAIVCRHSREIDSLAQGVIDKFFENGQIVPSPWSEPVQKVNLLAKIEEEERSMHNASSSSKRNSTSVPCSGHPTG